MKALLRKMRGALGIAVTWGAAWAIIGAGLSIVTGIVDPPSIDAGEGPLRIGAIFGAIGAVSGFAFGLVMSMTERRRSIGDLSIGRAALWGALGAAALPLLTTMNNSLLILVCPLGAAFAAASVALARRALPRLSPSGVRLETADSSLTRITQFESDSKMATTIRLAKRDDVAAIVRLLADDALGAKREIVSDPVAQVYLDAFDAMCAQTGNDLLVAESNGEVIGCLQVTFTPGLSRAGMLRATIEGVRVSSAHRGQRIGELLMQAAIDRAREKRCGLVQLTTDRTRVDAQRFYERLGFESTHLGMKLVLT